MPASWAEALDVAARGLAGARGAAGVLAGGRVTIEDAYGYAKFARVALGTNDVDFRARPHSAEEESFLAAHVAGFGLGVTYDDLENASTVLLVGLEPEEESPIVFLRLRKAVRRGTLRVHAVAPFAGRGLDKLSALAAPDRARRGGRGARRPAHRRPARGRGRRGAARGGRGHPRRRGPGLGAGRPVRRGRSRRVHRCRAGVGAAPRRRARSARGGCAALDAPRRPPGPRRGRPGRRRHGVGRDRPAGLARSRHRRHPARRPHRRDPRPGRRRRRPRRPARPDGRARGPRRGAVRRQPRAARVGRHRARRRRAAGRARWWRRRGPSSTGRAGGGRSRRCCAAPTPCRTSASCTSSPRRWASQLGLPDVDTARAEIDELGTWDGERSAFEPVPAGAPPDRRRRRGRRRPGHLAPAARPRADAGRRALPRRHRPQRRRPGSRRPPQRASASSRAGRSPCPATAARCPRR